MTIATFTTTMGNQEGVDNLNGAFDKDIGHAHDGSDMNGGKINAGNVVNTPTGNIVATNVQAAITELDSEKSPSGYGIGDNIKLVTSVDVKGLGGGRYYCATCTNTPTGANGYLDVLPQSSVNKLLRFTNFRVGGTYEAQVDTGVLSSWKRTDGYIATASSAEAIAGTDNTKMITPLQLRNGLNAGGTAPIYACRAWVNFNGVPLNGTYSQSGTTVTVTMTTHLLTVGDKVNLSVTSGTGVSGTYVVATVPNANSFTYTAGTSLTTSGNITKNIYIRASGNVSSVADNGVGDYTVNFTTAMPDANYCITGFATFATNTATAALVSAGNNITTNNTNYCRVQVGNSVNGVVLDSALTTVAIIG